MSLTLAGECTPTEETMTKKIKSAEGKPICVTDDQLTVMARDQVLKCFERVCQKHLPVGFENQKLAHHRAALWGRAVALVGRNIEKTFTQQETETHEVYHPDAISFTGTGEGTLQTDTATECAVRAFGTEFASNADSAGDDAA